MRNIVSRQAPSFHMVKIVFGHSEVVEEPSRENPQPIPIITHNAEVFGQGHSLSNALDDAMDNLKKFVGQLQIEISAPDPLSRRM